PQSIPANANPPTPGPQIYRTIVTRYNCIRVPLGRPNATATFFGAEWKRGWSVFDRFRFPNIIVILVLGIALTGLAIFPASPAGAADTQLKLFVNGREVKPDVPPVLMEGRVLLPIRFVSDLVNTPITWEDDTQR